MPTPDDRVVVLAGKELFLRTEHTEHLRKQLAKAHGDCESFRFEGEGADPAAVLDECRSFGLMAAHKLVVVDDADAFVTKARAMLERYCAAPSEQATLVLRAGTWRAGNLDKLIEQVGVIVRCDEVDRSKAAGWLTRRAQSAHGVAIEPDAVRALIERTGCDLGRLDSDLGKLAANAGGPGGAGTITAALVAELVGLTREENAWAIQRVLLTEPPERALGELRVVLGNGKSDAAVPMSFAMCDLARKLVGAAEGLERGTPPAQIGRELGLWGDATGPVLDAARRMGPGRARALFDRAIGVDAGIKSGSDAERSLELLALAFMA